MHGNKKFMTVSHFYIRIHNEDIGNSIIMTENIQFSENNSDIICSACLCIMSDKPIFQFQ